MFVVMFVVMFGTTGALHLSAAPLYHNCAKSNAAFCATPDKDLPQGPMAVFVHNEKSGGSFIEKILVMALRRSYMTQHENELPWELNRMPEGHPMRVPPQNYFVISSVRNPCTQLVSIWAYMCEKAWVAKSFGDSEGYAKIGDSLWESRGLCPKFSGRKEARTDTGFWAKQGLTTKPISYTVKVEDANAKGFAEAIKLPGVGDAYERQFNRTFSTIGLDRVNCWIRMENLKEDARKCIQEFAQFSGQKVDLSGVEKAERLEPFPGQSDAYNSGHHASCEEYFPPDGEAEHYMHTMNSFLFKRFGYGKCCDSK